MIGTRPLRYAVFAIMVSAIGLPSWALAQEGGTGDEPVTRKEFAKFLEEYRQFREEYAKTKEENKQLRSELAEVRANLSTLTNEGLRAEFAKAAAEEREVLRKELSAELRSRTEPLLPGLTNFTLGGFATVGYQDRHDSDSTFSGMIAPILLWKPSDRILFESEVHLALGEEETHVDLGYAHVSFLLNDYVTLGAGKFLLPFGTFQERTHPSWINKLPTAPLIYSSGLVGESGLGFQLRGGFPIGPTKVNYSTYIINGPDFGDTASDAGRLGFARNRDNNNDRAFGGRIGFLPIPELEIGYSILSGRVGDSGSLYGKVDTLMQGFDFSYAREFDAIKGRLDLRGEYVWVDTDDVIFIGPFDPFTFDNNSQGWYAQVAYRPTKVDTKLFDKVELKNLEFVFRYDRLRRPGPRRLPARRLGIDRDQFTLGLDYWIKPNVVLKTAYVFDNAHGDLDRDGFYLQLGIGF